MLILIREALFDRLFKILRDSFPIDEIRPFEKQKALLNRSDYKIYGIVDGDEIKGFLATYDLNDFLFIEHFAVNEKYRNEGLGSVMLQELIEKVGKPLILEVELPENELSKRRIAFYERNGFYFNDFPYIQPLLAEGQNPIPLRIMSTGKPLDNSEFENIKDILYKSVYSCR